MKVRLLVECCLARSLSGGFRSNVTLSATSTILAVALVSHGSPASAQTQENINLFSNALVESLEPQLKTDEEKDRYVATSMRDLQRAAERYACFHDGKYPTVINQDFQQYFRGGSGFEPVTMFCSYVNPFTGKRQLPTLGVLDKPLAARKAPPPPIEPGLLRYCPVGRGKTYAIIGGAHNGMAITGKLGGQANCKTYVLTSDPYVVTLANMRYMGTLLTRYSHDHNGLYPRSVDGDFKTYFPSGDRALRKIGTPPRNPYNGLRQWPVAGKYMDPRQARLRPPHALFPGALEYSSSPTLSNFIVRAGGADGKALPSANGGTLVIARDGDGSEKGPSTAPSAADIF